MWPTSQQPAWTLTHRIIMILYFLTFWSYLSFWFCGYNVLLTIFENVHRPCRHHFIIVDNSLYHVYPFFPHFLAIFTSVTILGNVHRLCKRYINNITKSLHHTYLFLLIFPDFLVIFLLITILGNAHRPYVNNTQALLTMIYICIFIFPVFSWFSDYIYINYHIRKCAQNM